MGDRANVKMTSRDGSFHFYTHHDGTELPKIVQEALRRGKGRWTDDPYLSRIIFSEMIQNWVMDDTGYGISIAIGDGDDRIVTVDTDDMTVELNGIVYSFYEYVELLPNALIFERR